MALTEHELISADIRSRVCKWTRLNRVYNGQKWNLDCFTFNEGVKARYYLNCLGSSGYNTALNMLNLLACWLHGYVRANHDWQIIEAVFLTLLKDIFQQPQNPHLKGKSCVLQPTESPSELCTQQNVCCAARCEYWLLIYPLKWKSGGEKTSLKGFQSFLFRQLAECA